MTIEEMAQDFEVLVRVAWSTDDLLAWISTNRPEISISSGQAASEFVQKLEACKAVMMEFRKVIKARTAK